MKWLHLEFRLGMLIPFLVPPPPKKNKTNKLYKFFTFSCSKPNQKGSYLGSGLEHQEMFFACCPCFWSWGSSSIGVSLSDPGNKINKNT